MLLRITDPAIMIYGIMLALRYPVTKRDARITQMVSFTMFMTSLRGVMRRRQVRYSEGDNQAESNMNEYIRYLHRLAGFPMDLGYNPIKFTSEAILGTFRVPSESNESVHFRVQYTGVEGFDFLVSIDVKNKQPQLEAAIMINWLSLDYSLSNVDITVEDQTLKLGLWLAAKLYECHGDLAGKLATIDEGLDMR